MSIDSSQFKHALSSSSESAADSTLESSSIASAGHTVSQKLGQEAFALSKFEPLQQAKLLGEGIVSGLALNSINGLTQIANRSIGTDFKAIHFDAQSEIDSSMSGNVGKMIGTSAAFFALALATKQFTPLSSKMLGSAALSESVAYGTAGALQGGLLTPTEKDLSGSSFFLARGGEALLGSGSAVLGAQGSRVAKLFQDSAPSLGVTGSLLLSLGSEAVFNGALGAGTAHAYSYMHTGEFASNEEVATSVILSAGIGLGASALSFRKGAAAAPINEQTQGLKHLRSELYLDRNVSTDTHLVSSDSLNEVGKRKFVAAEGDFEFSKSFETGLGEFHQHSQKFKFLPSRDRYSSYDYVPSDNHFASPEPRATQGMPSLAELEEQIVRLQTMLGAAELPTSATSDPATWKFIPEKATQLDASKLQLLDPAEGRNGSTELGDMIVQIKRYINSEGESGREYLARIAKSSDITIIGEQHTLDGPNPHRVLGAEVLGELPPGSTLAVELPSSLKPNFEQFNNNRGSDLPLSSQFGDMMSMQPALSLLRTINSNFPDLVNMWKSARDKGARVVPIDVELDPSVRLTSESREATIAANLLALSDSASGKPVVAWFGQVHAAKGTQGGIPLLAKRIAESPEFASGKRTLNTVLSQLAEKEAERSPLAVLAKEVREPVVMPTFKHGKETLIGEIPVMDKATAALVKTDIKVSDYDHLILYPPTTGDALVNYYMQRADALMAGIGR